MKSMFRNMQQIKTSEMAKTVVFGSGARIFALGSQFIVLLILSRIMSKENFGDMMVVFAVYRLGSMALGTGLGNLVLYHVGRSGGDVGLDRRIHRSATLAGILLSGVLTSLTILSAETVAAAFGKPGLIPWLAHMAPLMLFGTLNTIAVGSLDGRSRITTAIMISEVVPNAIRLGGLALIPTFDLPVYWAAHVLWISVALPWLWEARHLISLEHRSLSAMSIWDVRYVGLSAFQALTSLQLQGIDMVVVGLLFSSEVAGSYAIASRIATLYPFFQFIILRKFSPHAGYLIKNGDISSLNTKLAEVRHICMVSVGLFTGAILASSSVFIPIFGDYLGVEYLLVALSLPAIARTLFAGTDVIVRMSGQAGLALMVSLCGFSMVALTPLLFGTTVGILSLAIGMFGSAILLNPIFVISLAKQGVKAFSYSDLVPVGLAISIVISALLQFDTTHVALVASLGPIAMAIIIFSRKPKTCPGGKEVDK